MGAIVASWVIFVVALFWTEPTASCTVNPLSKSADCKFLDSTEDWGLVDESGY
jgi:hypothetical protein